MKKIAVMLLAALMLFAFVACDNEPQKSDAGQKLYDMFDGADGFSDNIAITSDGSGLLLKMVKDENELTINGPVAYFDESKLLAVENGQTATISFTLDASAMAENDYTFFSVGYSDNQKAWAGEGFLGIMKSNDNQYVVASSTKGQGVGHDNLTGTLSSFEAMHEYNIETLTTDESKKTITSDDGILDVVIEVAFAQGAAPAATATVNDGEVIKMNSASAEGSYAGLRNLWNVISSTDGVVIKSLDVSVK